MPVSAPSVTSGWELHGTSLNDGSGALFWNDNLELPQLGPTDIVVKLHAWALNYPDLAIANGTFPWKPADQGVLIPGSDGAGEVVAVGSHVKKLQISDRVIVVYYPNFRHGNAPTLEQMQGTPGGNSPGIFCYHGVFDETPTAWNALHGLAPLKAGDYVVAQGTGGVSLFAILFALAAGATVIATTSSTEKARKLQTMGVQHVLNYREDREWGDSAKKLTRGELGCQCVIEVGGPQTIKQSFNCVARGGEIDVIGFLTGQGHAENGPTFLEPLLQACLVRGIEVGNHIQFGEMNRAIEGHGINPVIDLCVFSLRDLKEAYKYAWNQRHFGKVVLSDSSE